MPNDPDWERDVYARGRQVNRWPFSELIADVVKATRGRERESMAVLETACGAGNNLWFLADAGFKASGLDKSDTAIKLARARLDALGHGGVDLRVADMGSLPWEDQRFDVVIDRGGISCLRLDEMPAALDEIRRVLRPGGLFLGYYLFGTMCSDRRYGREVAPGTHASFTEGRFKDVPRVTFLDVPLIRRLWHRMTVDAITRHEITRDGEASIEERFSVTARRPASG